MPDIYCNELFDYQMQPAKVWEGFAQLTGQCQVYLLRLIESNFFGQEIQGQIVTACSELCIKGDSLWLGRWELKGASDQDYKQQISSTQPGSTHMDQGYANVPFPAD